MAYVAGLQSLYNLLLYFYVTCTGTLPMPSAPTLPMGSGGSLTWARLWLLYSIRPQPVYLAYLAGLHIHTLYYSSLKRAHM